MADPDSAVERAPRVLVVEDEVMIAMLVEDMLIDLGFEVVGPALDLEGALPLAEQADLDLAVLDVNLGNGRRSFQVADVLRERGVPFLFATGYGTAGLSEAYAGSLTLKKPFECRRLGDAIQEALRDRTAGKEGSGA